MLLARVFYQPRKLSSECWFPRLDDYVCSLMCDRLETAKYIYKYLVGNSKIIHWKVRCLVYTSLIHVDKVFQQKTEDVFSTKTYMLVSGN